MTAIRRAATVIRAVTVIRAATRAATVSAVLALPAILGGCVLAGPTYGTEKRVGVQLLEDVASITSLRKEAVTIDHKPRPGLVPAPDGAGLPVPQRSVTETTTAWAETPEALRARLAAEGELNGVDTRSVLAQSKRVDPATGKRVDMRARAAAITQDGSRRKLSDPPVQYRQAAATAPTGDLGTPEYKKERARKAAQGDDERGFLRRLLPF